MTSQLFKCVAVIFTTTCYIAISTTTSAAQSIAITNPGFEADGANVAIPLGWNSSGNRERSAM